MKEWDSWSFSPSWVEESIRKNWGQSAYVPTDSFFTEQAAVYIRGESSASTTKNLLQNSTVMSTVSVKL